MVLSSADAREVKTIISSVFNEKFLEEVAKKVFEILERKLESYQREQEKRVSSLEERLDRVITENKRLAFSLDALEQQSRSKNLRIFGLPSTEGEDSATLRDKVLKLFKSDLKTNISNNSIKKCYRVPSKNPTDKPRAVLVRFSCTEAKRSVLKSRNLLKNINIQIKEDLTKIRLNLLESAVKKFTFKNAWVYNGNVYVKKGDQIHRITDLSDLTDI